MPVPMMEYECSRKKQSRKLGTVAEGLPAGGKRARIGARSRSGQDVGSRKWRRSCCYSTSSSSRPPRPSTLLERFFALFVLIPSLLGRWPSSNKIMASAATCDSASEPESIVITQSTSLNLSSVFDCEGGSFDVTWSGVVNVTSTIRIGQGTTVSIVGENSSNNDTINNGETMSNGSAAAEAETSFGPIFLVNGSDLYLDRLFIRGGNATEDEADATAGVSSGGGVYAMDANVTVVECVFEENHADSSGGGIFAFRSRLVVRDTIFRRCTAGFVPEAGDEDKEGEGGGLQMEKSDALVDSCLFEECYAGWRGGALEVDFGNITVANSTFSNNSAGSDNVIDENGIGEGGALAITVCYQGFEGAGVCGVNDSTFISNHVAHKGASIQLGSGEGETYLEVHRSLFLNNRAGEYIENDPQGEGGAMTVGSDMTLLLEDCVFRYNYAGERAGAISVSSGGDNGSWKDPGGAVFVRNTTFEGNEADQERGGVLYLAEYAAVTVEGDDNTFLLNHCDELGGVIMATTNTRITIEGGEFYGNYAVEDAAVLYSKGNVSIAGGVFANNEAYSRGGVFILGDGGVIEVTGGTFEGNIGGDHGGVGLGHSNTKMFIAGGTFSRNTAGEGGVFYVEEESNFVVTGGDFQNNEANFGGFLYRRGSGLTTCAGASIVNHKGVDGGGIYALEGAEILWECDLGMNEALAGPAIYVRGGSDVLLQDMMLYDNDVAHGSVVFVVGSTLRTVRVLLNDSTAAEDLSAVQIDGESIYIADLTSFTGFAGEAVVFSEGTVFLDSCDFSGSSAAILLYTEGANATSTVRNVVLGDSNYEAIAQAASDAGEIPAADSLSNANLTCNGTEEGEAATPPCSDESLCVEGDMGVYCQCFVRESTGVETCVSGDTDALTLTVLSPPEVTYFPDLVEGDLLLTHASDDASSSSISTTNASDLWEGGVMWNASVVPQDSDLLMDWTVFPSTGFLLPGESINLRVATLPSDEYDGTSSITFRVEGTGSSSAELRRKLAAVTETSMNVTFYHCYAGNFWNISSHALTASEGCLSCSDDAAGDVEGLDCAEDGASTTTLPITDGYWRATLSTVIIRECLNEDACEGGSVIASIDDYCATGYEGPYCAICSAGYGRGAGNSCHRCTESFKSGMYFVLVVATLLCLFILVILVAYLMGGQRAVTSILRAIKTSLQNCCSRGSNCFGATCCRCSRTTERTRPGASTPPSLQKPPVKVDQARNNSSVSPSLFAAADAAPSAPPRPRDGPLRSGVPVGKSQGVPDRPIVFSGALSAEADPPEPAGIISSEEEKSTVFRQKATGVSGEERKLAVHGDATIARPEKGCRNCAEGDDAGNGKRGSGARGKKCRRKTPICPITGLRSKIPLSKLKIVIVAWQILSAFASIVQVPLPPIYEQFLSIIGIFSFDIGWIVSASCLDPDIGFFDRLLFVTTIPIFLICVLGVTFYISSRPPASPVDQIHPTPPSGTQQGFSSLQSSGTGAPPRGILDTRSSRRSFLVRKPGPSGHSDLQQNHRWWLFARHTTILLVIMYLVYTQVSTVVFQTFACRDIEELGKSYLLADFRIECGTAKHNAYSIYAAFMILLYPLGIPLAFFYFLLRQKSNINPPVKKPKDVSREVIVREKLEKRVKDQTVAPTAFLWGAYYPNRYYYEIFECVRRLLLTGLLVFMLPDTAGQLAISCILAFISLIAFELLRPHVDRVDIQLYRTGCLVIFFSNFLALLIKAEVADANSNGSAAYAVALVLVNVLFFLSIWWNTWVAVGAMFSRDHAQGEVLGFDVLGEKQMNKILGEAEEENDDGGKNSARESQPVTQHRQYSSDPTSLGNVSRNSKSADEEEFPSPMPNLLGHVWHPHSQLWDSTDSLPGGSHGPKEGLPTELTTDVSELDPETRATASM